MRDWFRRLDEALFSPPHPFPTILAFVAVTLGWTAEGEQSRETETGERGATLQETEQRKE